MRPDLGLVVVAALVSALVSVAQGVGAPVKVTRGTIVLLQSLLHNVLFR